MRKAAAAGIILAGAILVAGGLDKESGSENFVADRGRDRFRSGIRGRSCTGSTDRYFCTRNEGK